MKLTKVLLNEMVTLLNFIRTNGFYMSNLEEKKSNSAEPVKKRMIVERKELFSKDEALEGKHSVFVVFVTEPYHHYRTKLIEEGSKAWDLKVGLLGILMRRDGSLGFAGGKVDEGETLEQAAVREVKEEINYDVNTRKLNMFCSHYMKDDNMEQHTHVMVCYVTPEEIYDIRSGAVNAEHSRLETAAFNVVHMLSKGIDNLMACNFAGTGKDEFKLLIDSGIIERPMSI